MTAATIDPRVPRRSRRRRAGLALFYASAVLAGLLGAWWSLARFADQASSVGGWQFSALAGSPDADLVTRARVARGALLALHRGETMYYLARSDSDGAPLRSRCRYRVDGQPPDGRWWSVTAYADDFFLFPDTAGRYSLNGSTARLDADGRFTLFSGPASPAEAGADAVWLPTPGDRGLMFTLRVYQPGSALQADPLSLSPPRIQRLGACP